MLEKQNRSDSSISELSKHSLFASQGPLVQSIVSLTTSLRRHLVKYMPLSICRLHYQIHYYFFAGKMFESFAMQKILTFFQQKITVDL